MTVLSLIYFRDYTFVKEPLKTEFIKLFYLSWLIYIVRVRQFYHWTHVFAR